MCHSSKGSSVSAHIMHCRLACGYVCLLGCCIKPLLLSAQHSWTWAISLATNRNTCTSSWVTSSNKEAYTCSSSTSIVVQGLSPYLHASGDISQFHSTVEVSPVRLWPDHFGCVVHCLCCQYRAHMVDWSLHLPSCKALCQIISTVNNDTRETWQPNGSACP